MWITPPLYPQSLWITYPHVSLEPFLSPSYPPSALTLSTGYPQQKSSLKHLEVVMDNSVEWLYRPAYTLHSRSG